MIKVLHIVTRIDIGGISSWLYNHYLHMDHSQIKLDVVAIDTGVKQGYHTKFEDLGMKVLYMPQHLLFRLQYLNRLIREEKYDVVHCHIELQSAVYLLVAALCGVKVRFSHSHLSVERSTFQDRVYRWLINKVSTKRFGVSKHSVLTVFGKKYVKDSPVLYNALDVKQYSFDEEKRFRYRTELQLDSQFVVGFVGRLTYLKNLMYLIDVFVELTKIHPDTVLLIVGAGEMQGQFDLKIREKGIQDKVIMIGARSDVNNWLQAMDVLLLPSYSEGLGRVLIEAQAAALKCIASREGVSQEAKISDYLLYQEIGKPAVTWAEFIMKECLHYKREPIENVVTAHNYNIERQAKNLQNYYVEAVDKVKK